MPFDGDDDARLPRDYQRLPSMWGTEDVAAPTPAADAASKKEEDASPASTMAPSTAATTDNSPVKQTEKAPVGLTSPNLQ